MGNGPKVGVWLRKRESSRSNPRPDSPREAREAAPREPSAPVGFPPENSPGKSKAFPACPRGTWSGPRPSPGAPHSTLPRAWKPLLRNRAGESGRKSTTSIQWSKNTLAAWELSMRWWTISPARNTRSSLCETICSETRKRSIASGSRPRPGSTWITIPISFRR